MEHRETYTASPCSCGHRVCKAWHVSGVAQVQGVYFTEKQARAVADLLMIMEGSADSVTWRRLNVVLEVAQKYISKG